MWLDAFCMKQRNPSSQNNAKGFRYNGQHCRLEIVTNCNEASIIMCVRLLYEEKHFKGLTLKALPIA